MHPTLFSIGQIGIASYPALLDAGLLAAALITMHRARRADLSLTHAIDVILMAIVFGVSGARIGYVAVHWPYFKDHLDEAWHIWQGGLSWHGGLIGGALGVWLIARTRLKQSPGAWLDLLAPGAALGAIFGWLACFLAGCAFGREVLPGEALFGIAIDAPDAYGTWAPRLPSQLFGAAWALLVFIIILSRGATAASSHRQRPGMRFALFVALYFAGSFAIGFSRADAAAWIGALSVEQVLDAIFFLAAVLFALPAQRRPAVSSNPSGASHADRS